jgi:DUF1365 family protein
MSDRATTIEENGPPPREAAIIYEGSVVHARLRPFTHRFDYSVFSLLVDADRLAEVDGMSKFLSVNRANIASFRECDHVEQPGETLRGYADRLLGLAGLAPAERVLLLAYPRILGYVFNPLSVWFCYGPGGRLVAVIYAVRNTFGQRHTYVAPVGDGELGPAGLRQSRAKLFHVSPFVGMDARYNFRILPPGRTVRLRILETEQGEPMLSATFRGLARPLGTASMAACLLKFPLLTWKIIGGIHWEALKLWLKGARFRSSPPAPQPVSCRDAVAIEPGE